MKPLKKIDTAIAFLREHIDQGFWRNEQRLPDHRQLAAMANVGHRAMWNALHLLKNEKKIAFKHGTGIFVGQTIPARTSYPETGPHKRRWLRTKEALQKDIFTGKFRSEGRLPSIKELVVEYGVDFRTLQKALLSLVDDGLVKQDKKTFRIESAIPPGSTKTICLVMSSIVSGMEINPLMLDVVEKFISACELECTTRNIRLVKASWSRGLRIDNKEALLGTVVWQSLDLYDETEALASFIRRSGKPGVVVCLPGEFINQKLLTDIYNHYEKVPRCFICAKDIHVAAGSAMARFLLEKEHRTICFISHSPSLNDTDILSGLRSVYEKAGIANGVRPLFISDYLPEKLQAQTTKSDAVFDNSIQKEIKTLEHWLATVDKVFSSHFAHRLTLELFEIKTGRNLRSYYAGLFRTALSFSDATAWVFSEDIVACYGGMEFLRALKIEVPQQIGLVGMTNWRQSLLFNLTSYRYDFDKVARTAVSLIVSPDYAKKALCQKGTAKFNVDGNVIDRGSV